MREPVGGVMTFILSVGEGRLQVNFCLVRGNLVPRGCIPFGQHQGCKTSGIINVKMLANRNLIGYYLLPEVYEKEVSKQEIKVLRMLLLDVFDHVRDGQWERNLKMGDAN